ncbi:unnamed protein product, partial [Medioppia subpectinata]
LIVDMDNNELKGLIGPYNEGEELKLICTTNGVKPTEVRITQLTPILVADREAIFECNTFGSRPKATLYWLFDGTRHNTPLNGELQTSTTLTINLKHAHNGVSLTCLAQNSKIDGSAISDELKLDIQYIPQLSLQLGTPTISLQSLQEGNDIYFDCHIDANPRPNAPILWRFNGIIQSNVSLVLQRVTRSQSGTYQCEATNQQGIALSNAIHLKIRYAPVCSTPFTLAFGVSLHESVDLECNVDANPPQVSFQWKFEGITDLANFNKINETSSILTYAPQSGQEYGTVECMAKNTIGIQQKSCKYHIIQADSSNSVFDNNIISISSSSLGGGVPALGSALGSGLGSSVTSNSFQLFVPNLTPATNFKLKLFATNSKGKSEQIWLKAQTLRPAERLVDSNSNASNDGSAGNYILRGKPMVMALLIGAGVVTLIVIALGVIAVVRVRRTEPNVQTAHTSQHDSRQQHTTHTSATLFEEDEDCEACCGDDCCDEMLLTSTTATTQPSQQQIQQQLHQNSNPSKGPPDIIPSFGFISGGLGLDNKNYITYGYQSDDVMQYVPQNDDLVHYAELSFCGQPLPAQQTIAQPSMTTKAQQQQQCVEYAKIEFNKSAQNTTQRVNLIGSGSPKFESTV